VLEWSMAEFLDHFLTDEKLKAAMMGQVSAGRATVDQGTNARCYACVATRYSEHPPLACRAQSDDIL
jgi:hypothetical protein